MDNVLFIIESKHFVPRGLSIIAKQRDIYEDLFPYHETVHDMERNPPKLHVISREPFGAVHVVPFGRG
jgi:hypothetical protein